MATMVAVDLGAQTGRVAVGRYDGVASRSRRCTASRTSRCGPRGAAVGRAPPLRRRPRRAPRGRTCAGDVDSVGVDSWAVDFGLLDSKGRLLQNPVHYRDARRASAFDGVLAAVPGARALRAHRDPAAPDQHDLRARGDGGGARPGAVGRRDAAAGARPHALLAQRRARHRVHERDHDAVPRRRARARGRSTCSSGSTSRRGSPPEIVAPGTALGPLRPTSQGRLGCAPPASIAPATHDTGSAVAAVPFRRPGAAYISAGTWSLVGIEVDRPVIDDRTFAANLTNEGGVGGTYRLLRNVTGLWLLHECRRDVGRSDGSDSASTSSSRWPRRAPPLRSLVDPDDPLFGAPGDMPRADPRRLRAEAARTSRRTPAARRAVHPREPRARSTGRRSSCCASDRRRRRRRCTSSAAARRTSCSASGRPTRPGCRCSQGRRRRPRSGTSSCRRSRSASSRRSRRDASSSRASFAASRLRAAGVPEWGEARGRFAELDAHGPGAGGGIGA